MQKTKFFIVLIIILFGSFLFFHEEFTYDYPKIKTLTDLEALFCKTEEEIEILVTDAISKAEGDIKEIISVPNSEKSFTNTVLAYDLAISNFIINIKILRLLSYVTNDSKLRKKSEGALQHLNDFMIEKFDQNLALYKALGFIKDSNFILTENEENFLNEILSDFEKINLQKDQNNHDSLKKISKDLSELELSYQNNIVTDNKCIALKKEQLPGISQNYLEQFKETKNGYLLKIDKPTVDKILQNCENEYTRKIFWHNAVKKGYPQNFEILKSIITLRNEFAKKIGCSNFAEFEITSQMAENVKCVESFLDKIFSLAKDKAIKEIAILKKHLPLSVCLIDGKFKPWDFSFCLNYYKKNYFNVDEEAISEYFPANYTIPKLLKIYEQFFGISFKKINYNELWNKDLEVYQVFRFNTFLGTLIMDLYARENKFTDDINLTVVQGFMRNSGTIFPSLSVIITNFSRPTENKPVLLRRKEVIRLFHECGHAIHSFVGLSEFISQSGLEVQDDFIEMPSQILEYWMQDAKVLKEISCHYKTQKKLDDITISKIKDLESFGKGIDTLIQIFYSKISLDLFKDANTDIQKVWQRNYCNILNYLTYEKDDFECCSFEHLISYGSKYYVYLWSKALALDLFKVINRRGLLNCNVGKKYIYEILRFGGSKDPSVMLENFLGRKPSFESFFEYLKC